MPFLASVEGSYAYGRGPQLYGGNGSTSNNPAVSAIEAYNAGNTTNGWYWIKTSGMTEARQVWCNQQDNGGGWMLASYNGNKQSATATVSGQFYPVAWSNGQGTLSGQFAVNAMDLWYHNGINQCSNVMRVASMTSNAVPTLANSYIAHTVTYTTNANKLSLTPASGVQGTGVFSTSNVLMTGLWSNVKGYTILSNYTITSNDSDWMYNTGTSFYWIVCQSINDTSRGGSGLDTGAWMRTQGKDSWGLLSNCAVGGSSLGSSFPGNTLAIFIK